VVNQVMRAAAAAGDKGDKGEKPEPPPELGEFLERINARIKTAREAR
jgi:hypothetical protein